MGETWFIKIDDGTRTRLVGPMNGSFRRSYLYSSPLLEAVLRTFPSSSLRAGSIKSPMTMLRLLPAFLAAFVFFLNSALGAAPAISTQPASQNVLVGAAVTLSVTATGTGTLTYQWQKDGFNVDGATSATYSIASAAVSHSGSYTVIVTNADGSTTSSAAILTVYPDPSVRTHPVGQTVIAGATVRFSVVAIGTGTLTYEWRKDGEKIPNATSASYVIMNATPADAGDYRVFVENTVTGGTNTNVLSNPATLVVRPLPTITAQPVGVFVNAGDSATFSVGVTGTGTLSYRWQKGTTDIEGATSASFTINSAQAADAGSYRVIVTDSIGSTTSSSVALIVGAAAPTTPVPDGYGASSTGGGQAAATTVTTASEFRSLAEDATARVITVSGSLDLGAAKVAVKSNKTIQGLDANAALRGNLELASGVSHVIIRGLTITNPTGYGNGDGISIIGATNVYITHCSFFDCTDGLLDITAGADNVTVSWCEFYYTNATAAHRHAMMIGAETGETKALRVTLHHNSWSEHVDQSMPVTTWGQVHMYSNLINSVGNTAATKVQASAQLLSEHNRYVGVKDSLVKSGTGLIRANSNVYTNTTLTTGTTAEPATDSVFTPSYSYEMLPASDWTAALEIGAGNTAGAASASPVAASVTAKSTATTLTAGESFTLSAELTGFSDDDVGYQWRFNNVPIPGGDRETFVVNGASTGQSGTYTVLVLKSSTAAVVSSPVAITVNAAASTTTPTETDDGGGSPSVWFFAALSLVALGRRFTRRSGETTSIE
jgi:MYXO-CTERM domain-containing protein